MPIPALEAKDIVAILGIVINLAFNAFNYHRTNKLRGDTLRLDEFKRLRAAVDTAVAAIRSHRNTLRSLEASGSSVTKVRKEVSDCNKALADQYESLCDALQDLNNSALIKRTDWLSGVSEAWDEIGRTFNGAYVHGIDLAAVRAVIKRLIAKLDEFLKLLHAKLDSEIAL